MMETDKPNSMRGSELKMTIKSQGALLTVILACGLTLSTGSVAGSTQQHKFDRKVAAACAKANGFVLPSGSPRLTASQLDKIHNCEKQYRLNVRDCAQTAGVANPVQPAQVQTYRQCENEALSKL